MKLVKLLGTALLCSATLNAGYEGLITAILNKNVQWVEGELASLSKAELNRPDEFGISPLHYALIAANGGVPVFKNIRKNEGKHFQLIPHDIVGSELTDVVLDILPKCVQSNAGESTDTYRDIELDARSGVVQSFLKTVPPYFSDVLPYMMVDRYLRSVFFKLEGYKDQKGLERSVQIIHLLVEAGADVNQGDERGITPLIASIVLHTPIEVKDLLIEQGADVNCIFRRGSYSPSMGNKSFNRWGADDDSDDDSRDLRTIYTFEDPELSYTPLALALFLGDAPTVKLLLKNRSVQEKRFLMQYFLQGNWRIAQEIYSHDYAAGCLSILDYLSLDSFRNVEGTIASNDIRDVLLHGDGLLYIRDVTVSGAFVAYTFGRSDGIDRDGFARVTFEYLTQLKSEIEQHAGISWDVKYRATTLIDKMLEAKESASKSLVKLLRSLQEEEQQRKSAQLVEGTNQVAMLMNREMHGGGKAKRNPGKAAIKTPEEIEEIITGMKKSVVVSSHKRKLEEIEGAREREEEVKDSKMEID